ncbi:MAG: SH3 domain-containing protein [Candidatus Limivicinus sp.]|nr:SH3 domain-containing protein [Candidatus Limivicinus sp.]
MRKKTLRIFVAAVVITSMMSVPAYAENAVVTGNDVNFRVGPGTNYRVIDSLSRGTAVTVSDRSNSAWYAVDYDGYSGFMSSSYLSITEEDYSHVTVSSGEDSAYINAMYVRFRSGPSSASSILGEYNRGKSVTVTGRSGDWTACIIDGQAGYVYSRYVTGGAYITPEPEREIYASYGSGGLEFGGNSQTEQPAEPVQPEKTPEPVWEPTPQQGSGYICGDFVRFRTGPSSGYSIIDSYNRGTPLTVTGVSGDWTACIIDGQSGYVFSQYVTRTDNGQENYGSEANGEVEIENNAPAEQPEATPETTPVETKDGYISGNNVRMRNGASMSAGILCELSYGNRVTICGYSGDWTNVIYDGQSGYVYSQYVREGSLNYSEIVNNSGDGSDLGRQIADYALQFVGYNYSWGGKSPSTGFDCSGLVYYVYSQFGYTLNRVACDQANNGVAVTELQPGDILCFYSGSSYIGHVGIYIGDNKFVHAQNSATGVVVTELAGYYATRGYEARRIV